MYGTLNTKHTWNMMYEMNMEYGIRNVYKIFIKRLSVCGTKVEYELGIHTEYGI